MKKVVVTIMLSFSNFHKIFVMTNFFIIFMFLIKKDLGTFLFPYIINQMETLETKKAKKVPALFFCKICDYSTSRKGQYERHLNTYKHINSTKINILELSELKSSVNYTCSKCNKHYKDRSGLWKHNKKCSSDVHTTKSQYEDEHTDNNTINKDNDVIDLLINENKDFKNMIMELVKSNTELQKQMVDVCKQIQPSTINTTNSHNNSHNKTFNLQVFLNEECKDAMNMSEFINSIQLKLSDLENIGNQGYIEGVSNILINHLNNTEMYKRPVHCSDAKRETLYIKEENKWEKEGPDNKKMKRAVQGVEKKNFLMLNQWKEKYPKCMDSESTQSDAYMKLISKVMNGDEENINKVIKRVAKEVVISK